VGICSSVIPYVTDQLAMVRLPRATFALMLALLPAAATVIGLIVLGQVPTLQDIAGVGLVILGVSLHHDPSTESRNWKAGSSARRPEQPGQEDRDADAQGSHGGDQHGPGRRILRDPGQRVIFVGAQVSEGLHGRVQRLGSEHQPDGRQDAGPVHGRDPQDQAGRDCDRRGQQVDPHVPLGTHGVPRTPPGANEAPPEAVPGNG
jgi:hypothetical protein